MRKLKREKERESERERERGERILHSDFPILVGLPARSTRDESHVWSKAATTLGLRIYQDVWDHMYEHV